MTDTKELRERLLSRIGSAFDGEATFSAEEVAEAASAIERLEAERDEARQVAAYPGSAYAAALEHAERAGAAQAEVARLREALRPCVTVLQMLTDPKVNPTTSMAIVWAQCVEAETRARAALDHVEGVE